MKIATANEIRKNLVDELTTYFTNKGEDVGIIASNTINFPFVSKEGEEGWIELVVKIPKGTKDEEYDGYGRREQYQIDAKEKAEKKAIAEEKKKKKIEKDKAKREKGAQTPFPCQTLHV